MCSAPMVLRIFSWVCRQESVSNIPPILNDGNIYRFSGVLLVFLRPAACWEMGRMRTEFCVLGWLTASSPLIRFTCFVMEIVLFSMSRSARGRRGVHPAAGPWSVPDRTLSAGRVYPLPSDRV